MARRLVLVPLLAALVLAAAPPVTAAPAAPGDPAVSAAGDYLAAQQRPDGGFDHLGAYFEGPDTILALAEAAQTGPTWSTVEALDAVEALAATGGATPLTHLDDLVDEVPDDVAGAPDLTAGQAAKLIVLVLAPLGLDAEAFDPDGDGGRTDLVAVLDGGRRPDGSYGFFGATLYALMAIRLLGATVPPDTLALVRDAQRDDGSWNFQGDQDPAVRGDVDATALALQALAASGVAPADPALEQGLRFLVGQRRADGGFAGFIRVNSTAVATLAVAAAGYEPDEPCWRDRATPAAVGSAFVSPGAYLRGQQGADGSINDVTEGSAAFATAQAVQALRRSWLPVGGVASRCATSAQFVEQVYSDLLARAPDGRGGAFFAGLLGAGLARAAVAAAVVTSEEYRAGALEALYRDALGRGLDRVGRQFFLGQLAGGATFDDVGASIVASGEYRSTHGGTGAGVVEGWYLDLLGRPADRSGRAHFLGLLEAGVDPVALARALLRSSEGLRFAVRSLYEDVLGRPADRGGLAHFARLLAGGARIESVVVALVASKEYDRRARL